MYSVAERIASVPDGNAWAQLESNSISAEEFSSAFLEETRDAGHPIPNSQVLPLLSGDLRPRMLCVLRRCGGEPGSKLGCIINGLRSGMGPGMAASSDRAGKVEELGKALACKL